MVDRQQIDILRSRMNSIDGQTAAAQVHLFELVEKHGLDSRDTFWHLGPIDSSVALDYPLTDEEGHAFQKMSDKERNAFDKEKREKLEAERLRNTGCTPTRSQNRVGSIQRTEGCPIQHRNQPGNSDVRSWIGRPDCRRARAPAGFRGRTVFEALAAGLKGQGRSIKRNRRKMAQSFFER